MLRRHPTRTPSRCPPPGGRASARAGAASPGTRTPPRVGARLLGQAARGGDAGADRHGPRRGSPAHRPLTGRRLTPLSGGDGGSGRRRSPGRGHRPREVAVRRSWNVVDGAGHMLHPERPHVVRDAVLSRLCGRHDSPVPRPAGCGNGWLGRCCSRFLAPHPTAALSLCATARPVGGWWIVAQLGSVPARHHLTAT